MSEVSAFDMAIDAVVDWFTKQLQTPFDKNHETRVNLIRAGKLQDNPGREETNFLIHDGAETEPAELFTKNEQDGLKAPTFEVGGGSFHLIRIRVQMTMHFPGVVDREKSRRNANVIYARARQAVATMPYPLHPDSQQPQDDFGNFFVHPAVLRSGYVREGGGRGYFIWKGDLIIEFLTELLPMEPSAEQQGVVIP